MQSYRYKQTKHSTVRCTIGKMKQISFRLTCKIVEGLWNFQFFHSKSTELITCDIETQGFCRTRHFQRRVLKPIHFCLVNLPLKEVENPSIQNPCGAPETIIRHQRSVLRLKQNPESFVVSKGTNHNLKIHLEFLILQLC